MAEPNADPGERPDVIAELKRLGRQMGVTLDAVWSSAERRKVEEELRAGARAFAEECERAMGRARGTRPADVAAKARHSAVDGLRWMINELEALADRFPPPGEEDAAARETGAPGPEP